MTNEVITHFAVGDRVRALGTTSNVPTKKGDQGTVTWVSEGGALLLVKWDKMFFPVFAPEDDEWYALPDEVELVEPMSWFELLVQKLKVAIWG